MAPSSAFPCPTSSISFSFIFSLRSSFHLLCAAVSLPPAASPVPPACLSSLTLLCFFSFLCSPEEGSATSVLSQVAPSGAHLLSLLLQLLPSLASPGPLAPYRTLRWQKQSQKLRGGLRSEEAQRAGRQRASGRGETETQGEEETVGFGLQGEPGPERWRSTSPEAMAALYTSRGKRMAKQKL